MNAEQIHAMIQEHCARGTPGLPAIVERLNDTCFEQFRQIEYLKGLCEGMGQRIDHLETLTNRLNRLRQETKPPVLLEYRHAKAIYDSINQFLDEVGRCDHSVGICVCDDKQAKHLLGIALGIERPIHEPESET